MKKLRIISRGCSLQVGDYGVGIDDTDIQELIRKNLPVLKKYKPYPVNLDLEIRFLTDEGLEVETKGYELPKEETKEVEE